MIIIGFELPAMTVDDFYGANLIFNLATFLGIPASKIKVAKAVSEIKSRRKRDTIFKVTRFKLLICRATFLQIYKHWYLEIYMFGILLYELKIKSVGAVSPQSTDLRNLRTKHSIFCGENKNDR